MLLSSVYQNIIDVYLNSPLDQFGSDDEDVLSILDYSILDSIPGIRFIDEVLD